MQQKRKVKNITKFLSDSRIPGGASESEVNISQDHAISFCLISAHYTALNFLRALILRKECPKSDTSIQVIRKVDPFMVNKIVSNLDQSLKRSIKSYFWLTDKT